MTTFFNFLLLQLPSYAPRPKNREPVTVIAVTGSGQKKTIPSNALMAQTETRGLVKARPLLQPPPCVRSSVTLSHQTPPLP